MNWGQLVSQFHDYLGQDESNPAFFGSDSVRVFMEKALRRVNSHSKVVRKRQAVNITAGTRVYDLPDDCLEVYRVGYDGAEICQYTQARLNADSDVWRAVNGEPYLWYADRLNNQIGLYPNPTSSSTVAGASQEDGVPVLMGDTEDGLIIDISTDGGFPLAEDGIPVLELTANHLEVFYWALPADYLAISLPDVPQWAQHFLVFSALAEAYRVGIPDSRPDEARAFAVLAADLESSISSRAANVIPKVWHSDTGYSSRHRSIQQRFPETIGEVS